MFKSLFRKKQALDVPESFKRAASLHQQGKLAEADAGYQAVLAAQPDHFDARHMLGVIRLQQGRAAEAAAIIADALCINPDAAEALAHRGLALQALNRVDEAMASFDRSLAIDPNAANTLNNRGNLLASTNRFEAAIESYDRALRVRPESADAHNNRGNALGALGHHVEALESYDKAIAIDGNSARAYYNRGNAWQALGRHAEANADYEHALILDPDYVEALYNRGIALNALRRNDEAVADYDRALALRPGFIEARHNRGIALREGGRWQEANASFEQVIAADSDFRYVLGDLFYGRAQLCDWHDHEAMTMRVAAGVQSGKRISVPFAFLTVSQDPALQLACAATYVRDKYSAMPRARWNRKRYGHDRIRVGYMSADFRDHPAAYLIAELIEMHDRKRFDVSAIALGPDRPGEMRTRLATAFDRFVPADPRNDAEVAQLIEDLEIDILVDLMGFTRESRPGILAQHPAPIQVSYLGFPGTMGAEFIDYLLADEYVIPAPAAAYFVEKIVYLPDAFQVTDTTRQIEVAAQSRVALGLPEDGFVFCSFNNSYKLNPATFDVWMRLLGRIDRSALWILAEDPITMQNLRREAAARGIAPERIVFAVRAPYRDYLARYRLADLFLDSLPFNAGTTASDALWMGLPVLTCSGEAFAARMAASLLHAVGLPEMVAPTLEAYEQLAYALATQPMLLQEIRDKLARHRSTTALFDTGRFRRHIESAYMTMMELHRAGEAPRSFRVERIAT